MREATSATGTMKEFWDARAAEDAFFFVDNRLHYRSPDLERFWAGGEDAVDRILEMLEFEIEPSDEIVEIGCGLGRLTRVLAARGASVEAIDVSSEMLERAAALNPELEGVNWRLGDGVSLADLPTDNADLCFSFVVFQHIPDPEITLGYVREMGRVLRAGGRAAFHVSNDPGVHAPRSRGDRVRDWLRAVRRRGPRGQAHPSWRGSAVDLGELKETAAEAGMETERIVGAGTQYCFVLLRAAG